MAKKRVVIVGGGSGGHVATVPVVPQGDLPPDPGILRAAARHNRANVGVYAAVLHGGTIRRGDPVRLEAGA